jgi:hypothetical protein
MTVAPPASAAVVTAQSGGGVGGNGSLKDTKQDADKSGLAFKSLASAATPPAAQKTQAFFADNSKKAGSGNVQHFLQVGSESKAKATALDTVSPAKAVLASFAMEQIGSEIRIVDGDGSVYSGYTQLTSDTTRSRTASVAKEKPASGAVALRASGGKLEQRTPSVSDAESQASQNYYFRVAGTNRTLKQSVVFTGYLSPAAEATVINGVTNSLRLSLSGGARGAQTEHQEPSRSPTATTSRISGKVVLGPGKEVEINAVSAGRDK